MKKKVIITTIVLIILLIILILTKIKKEDVTNNTDTPNITYENKNIDFSGYEEKIIELSSSLNITEKVIYILSGEIKGNITINTNDNVKLVLNGVNIDNDDGPAIYIENADNTYIYLNKNTTNILNGNGTTDLDGVIYSKDDLFIDGDGNLEINSTNENIDGIVSKDDLTILNGNITITSLDDGIRGKDSVIIENGNINIKATTNGIKTTNEEDAQKGYILIDNGKINIISGLDGIEATTDIKIAGGTIDIKTGEGSTITSTQNDWGRFGEPSKNTTTDSMKGIKDINSILITGGTINLDTEDDSIHSNNLVKITNGIITCSSGDDGIHADMEIIIDNGTIKINKSYEGIEASTITINNGDIYIIASDDGINISGGNDSSSMNRPGQNNVNSNSNSKLTINDGYLYVDANGDGLDSNGNIYMNDGTVIVNGPVNDDNGALDYDGEFIIKGGLLIAAGSSGMAMSPSNNSTQNSVLINFSTRYTANTLVNIKDVITFAPSKTYSSILVSSPDLKLNTEYTISVGGMATDNINGLYTSEYSEGNIYQTFTQSSTITKIGNSYGQMGGQMGRQMDQRRW